MDEAEHSEKLLNTEFLEKLLVLPNVIQELNDGKNSKLIDYILRDDVLDHLIDIVLSGLHSRRFVAKSLKTMELLTVPNPIVASKLLNVDSKTVSSHDYGLLMKIWRGFFGCEIEEPEEPEFKEPEEPEFKEPEESEIEEPKTEEPEEPEECENKEPKVEEPKSELPQSAETLHDEENEEAEDHEQSEETALPEVSSSRDLLFITFSKFLENLMNVNAKLLMNFIRFEQEDQPSASHITHQFLRFSLHFQQFSEILTKLISIDKPFAPIGIIDLLVEQGLVDKCLEMVEKHWDDCLAQSNLFALLNGIVSISSNVGFAEGEDNAQNSLFADNPIDLIDSGGSDNPNVGPNDLTRSMVSPENVELLVKILLKGSFGLSTCSVLLIELIRKNNSDYDDFPWTESLEQSPSSRDPIYLGYMLRRFSKALPEICEKFLTQEYGRDMVHGFSAGGEIEFLGQERFKVMELIAELLHCSNMALLNKSYELDEKIYQRDQLRTKREQLVQDALTSEISQRDKNTDTLLSAQTERLSIGEFNTFKLSVGNLYKYQLIENDIIEKIVTMMHKFPWNNFCHNVIFDLVQQIFNGRVIDDEEAEEEPGEYHDADCLNKVLVSRFFSKFQLPNYLLRLYLESQEFAANNKFQLGYMGHLILICEDVVKFQNFLEMLYEKYEGSIEALKETLDAQPPSDPKGRLAFYLQDSFFLYYQDFHDLFMQPTKFFCLLEEEKLSESLIVEHNLATPVEQLSAESIRYYDNDFDRDFRYYHWNAFIDGKLMDIRNMYCQVLGGIEPDNSMLPPDDGKRVILLGNGEDEEELQEEELQEEEREETHQVEQNEEEDQEPEVESL